MSLKLSHLFLAAALALPTLALAGGPDGDRGDRHGPPRHGPPAHEVLLDNADEIGLDDATVARIQALADATRADMDQLREAAELARGTDAERSIHQAMRERGRALMDQIRGLLTDEQWAAAQEILPPPPDGRGGPRDGSGPRDGAGPRDGGGPPDGRGHHGGDCPDDDE